MNYWNIALCIVIFVLLIMGVFYIIKRVKARIEHQIIQKIKTRLDRVVNLLVKEFPKDPRTQRLYERYQNTKLFESNNHETYTINKGEKIVMCIKNYAQNQKIHDDFNILMFVGLHELSHIMSVSVDHTDEFWSNFRFILNNASKWGLYVPVDYTYDPVDYCKMVVNDNPHFYERTTEEFVSDIRNILQK